MKKILVIIFSALLCSSMLIAQDKVTTTATPATPVVREKQYTPEQGDFAIGTDMVPLFRALGNVFYNQTSPSPKQGFGGDPYWSKNTALPKPDVSLLGKYMVTDEIAARINFGVFASTETTTQLVDDMKALAEDPLSTAEVENIHNKKMGGFQTTLGGEYRIGKKRIQGVFGADVIFGCYSTTNKYTYGNKASELNPTPAISSLTPGLIEQRAANAWLVGGQLTAGVEFFIIPKLALGGQVNLSYVASLGGKTYSTTEIYDSTLGAVKQITDVGKSSTRSGEISTNNIGGGLYLMFYF